MFFFQDKDIKTKDENGRLLGKLGDGSFGIVCKGQWVIHNHIHMLIHYISLIGIKNRKQVFIFKLKILQPMILKVLFVYSKDTFFM